MSASDDGDVVSLFGVLTGEAASVQAVVTSWQERGYVLVDVRAPATGGEGVAADLAELGRLRRHFADTMPAYFETVRSAPEAERAALRKGKMFGLVEAGHKTSFRLLTGGLCRRFAMPSGQRSEMELLAAVTDRLMLGLLQRLAGPAFGVDDVTAFCLQRGLLLGLDAASNAGMLDFAYYHRRDDDQSSARSKFLSSQGLDCVDHHDPGLFSLSFLSTEPGLELYDWTRQCWHPAPYGVDTTLAVLWTGAAAVEAAPAAGPIKPGRHRVVCQQHDRPRMAVWHELCTANQIHSDEAIEAMQREAASNDGLLLPNVGAAGMQLKMTDSTPELALGMPLSKRAPPVKSFGPKLDAEIKLGLATSKIIRAPKINFNQLDPERELGLPVSKSGVVFNPEPLPVFDSALASKSGVEPLEPASKSGVEPLFDLEPASKSGAAVNSTQAKRLDPERQLGLPLSKSRPMARRQPAKQLDPERELGLPMSKSDIGDFEPLPEAKQLDPERELGLPMSKSDIGDLSMSNSNAEPLDKHPVQRVLQWLGSMFN